MRLDVYLGKQKNKLTRSKAKRAIKLGFVLVNKRVCTKPAYNVKEGDIIEVTNKRLARMPQGYFKLAEVQKLTELIKPSDAVLDLGSSAGGFLYYASEIAKQVYGVEFSTQFRPQLEALARRCGNVKVMFGDVFKMFPSEITGGEGVDLILNDLSLDWEGSLKALAQVLPLLKKDGKVLMTVKGKASINEIAKALEPYELRIVKNFKLESEKKEFYLILMRA